MTIAMLTMTERTWLDNECWFDFGPSWISNPDEVQADLCARTEGAWETGTTFVHGKHYDVPRLWAWVGVGFTADSSYTEQKDAPAFASYPWVREIAESLGREYGTEFNSCLLNLYPSGWNSVGWHFDRCVTSGEVVAGVSLGATRRFRARPRTGDGPSHGWDVGHGDLYVMGGPFQDRFQHSVPKTTRDVDARLSLTFRHVAK
jgi:alkylated DNA repair dioxygenase AlkB